MKHYRSSLLLSVLFLVSTNYLFSQAGSSLAPMKSVASPNTASLGLYGEVPVTLFTGVPDISIPINSIQNNDISVPVTLNYHSSGTRIDQHPSWVGLGWSLQVGGSIDRVQRGFPDEKNFNTYPPSTGGVLRGYYTTHSIIDRSDWDQGSFIGLGPDFDGSDRFLKDMMPDEFRFSFPGNSGSFFLSESGSWRVRSDRPVKVILDEADITNNPAGATSFNFSSEKTIKKFTLIDGFGFKYIFGGTEESIEYSDRWFSQSQGGNYFSSNSWKLTKIIAPSGEELFEFGYERGPTVPQLYYTAFQKSFQSGSGSFYCGGASTSWPNSIQYQERGNVVSPVYLKYVKCTKKDIKINFITDVSQEMSYVDPNGGDPTLLANNPYLKATYGIYKDENGGNNPVSEELTGNELLMHAFLTTKVPYFQTNQADPKYWRNILWFKLKRIEVTNASGSSLNNTIRFDYNNGADERLRLSKVVFLDKSSTAGRTYELRYNTQTIARYLSSVGDHWGFYNNGPSATSIYLGGNLPTIENYRQPSLQYTQAGVLNEIIYPTGGSTKFEYELNTSSKVVKNVDRTLLEDYNSTIGGLRVKKITNDNGAGNVVAKEYFYVKNYTLGANVSTLTSSGILLNRPAYSFGFTSTGSPSLIYQAYYLMPLLPLTDFSTGNYIGYSEVVEKLPDGSFTIFKYTNHDNGYNDENWLLTKDGWFNYQLQSSSRSHERGKLLEQSLFDNAGTIVSKTVNTYARNNNNYVRGVQNGKDFFCYIPPMGFGALTVTFDYWHKTAFRIYYNSLNLSSSATTTYAKGNPSLSATITKTFQYNSNNDIASEQVTDSKGNVMEQAYKYPSDFSSGEPYATMLTRNMISSIVQLNSLKDASNQESIKTNYDFWTGTSWSSTATNLILPRFQESKGLGQSTFEPRLRYHSYDDIGNLTSNSKESDVIRSYIWGYNKSRVIAEIVNAQPREVYIGDFEQNGWSGLAYTNGRAHTGKYSGKILNPGPGELVVHADAWLDISLTQPTKFKYSGWVYSTGPSVEIFLFMKTASEPGYYTYIDSRLTSEKNKWVYLEGEYTVPANITRLNIRLDNNGPGTAWFDDVRLHPSNAYITTYNYDTFNGLTSKTDMNNRSEYYQYDGYGRLVLILDNDKNVIKKICYNFAGQTENCALPVFTNEVKQGTFTKNNCIDGGVGSAVTYTVPSGTYTSYISVEEANQQAQDQIDALGQANANTSGNCTWSNAGTGLWFTRNNCSGTGVGGNYFFPVAAGAFTSTTSLAHANQLAQNYLAANGQAAANANASCTWSSAAIAANFYKNNCGAGNNGNPYYVTVPAGAYTSTISQADADALANSYAQSQANSFGTCQQNITITCTSYAPSNCYQVEFYDPSTGFDIWFDVVNGTMVNLGTIPPGTYDIGFYSSGCDNGTYRTFGTSCNGSTGNSNGGAYFPNVVISLSCRGVYIN
jgi:YD repeat-containing protein